MGMEQTIGQGITFSAEEEGLYQKAIENNPSLSRAEFRTARDNAIKMANTEKPKLMNVGGHMLPVDDHESRHALEENHKI